MPSKFDIFKRPGAAREDFEEGVQTTACDNGLCPKRGLLQRLKSTRVLLGALNPN